jgi:hypothetical protein
LSVSELRKLKEKILKRNLDAWTTHGLEPPKIELKIRTGSNFPRPYITYAG